MQSCGTSTRIGGRVARWARQPAAAGTARPRRSDAGPAAEEARRRSARCAPTSPRWTRCSMASPRRTPCSTGSRGTPRSVGAGASTSPVWLAEQLAPRGTRPTRDGDQTRRALGSTDLRAAASAALERATRDATVDQIDRELRQLRDAAEQLRLVAAGTLFTVARTHRARRRPGTVARSRVRGREAASIGSMPHVLVTVQGALVQIVRNAVAHGIETASERRAAGKPAGRTGRARGRAARQPDRLRLPRRRPAASTSTRCGGVRSRRGLAAPTVAPARRRGPHATAACAAGISTSGAVTEVVGRGIGLDVVREAAERLGGEVVVRPKPARAPRFELAVPLSLASMEALIVEAVGAAAALPLDAVRGTMLRRRRDDFAGPRSARSIALRGDGRSPSCRCRESLERRASAGPAGIGRPSIVARAAGHGGDRGRPAARHGANRRPSAARAGAVRADRRRARRSTPKATRSWCSTPRA